MSVETVGAMKPSPCQECCQFARGALPSFEQRDPVRKDVVLLVPGALPNSVLLSARLRFCTFRCRATVRELYEQPASQLTSSRAASLSTPCGKHIRDPAVALGASE